jgi:hypothetical protein
MLKVLLKVLTFSLLLLNSEAILAQAFNPYQHAYQGWDGNKIKKASPLRAFLNKFSLNTQIGYGRTFYNHELNSDVLEVAPYKEFVLNGDSANVGPKLIILGDYTTAGSTINYRGITNWLNYPLADSGAVVLSPNGPGSILYADSAEISYQGSGFNIPVNVSLHFDIERFRIGGGIMYELHRINQLKPGGQGEQPYIPNFNSTFMFRYYFTAGAKVYHFMGWDYNVDIQIGKVLYGKQYDKSSLQNGIYFNLGLPFEYEMSEYFWLVVRPSFDFKSYSMTMAGATDASSTIQHNQPAFYLNFGVRMKIPEIKRCPVNSCRTQLKHVHGSREFRGQPFHKKQNPKIGELYRELIQNKRKNKNEN